ncbi:Zinc/cadmium resistance protein 1 [Colletotrichum chlorophyti]|uniref:Zinc/cadmium resistance protein 1 n=1 Tax=Colletotrichum chlorophyti TaxID=708187 RepID=A0A1Q8S7H8_9PEZI|nr:Zinc/cadmium resistance protein 1 [Colletotrichum chlorophyti]
MLRFSFTKKQRLAAAIAISSAFFVAELVIGFRTKSLALIADAFHYVCQPPHKRPDGFRGGVAGSARTFVAQFSATVRPFANGRLQVSERNTAPRTLTFGWKRAQVLGAFFNGVFLLALGISILLQAVERFINLTLLVMGCIGLGLNLLVMSFLHGEKPCDCRNSRILMEGIEEHDAHDHSHKSSQTDGASIGESSLTSNISSSPSPSSPDPEKVAATHHHHGGRDLGMLGVLIHVAGDAVNNVGVIVAAVVIWKAEGEGRFYADPGVSLFIALTIMLSAWPLCKRAGHILLESAPPGIEVRDLQAEMLKVSGVQAVAEMRVWRIDQRMTLATAHVVVADDSVGGFEAKAREIRACLQAHGVQVIALQPHQNLGTLGAASEVSEASKDV